MIYHDGTVRILKDELGATDDSFLDAGLLKIGNFEGYLVFLDLVTGEVVHIYHEAVYDMSIVDGVDVSDYEEVRDYLSSCILCKDFMIFCGLSAQRTFIMKIVWNLRQ